MDYKRVLIILVIAISSTNCYSQTHHWAEAINSKINAGTYATAIDSNHNSYLIGNFFDTLKINNRSFGAANVYSNNYIAKFDSEGKLDWCKLIYTKSVSKISKSYASINNIKLISNNRILIYGSFGFSSNKVVLMLSEKDSLISSAGTNADIGFVAIYDSTGNLSWYKKVFRDGKLEGMNGQIDIDIKNNIYLTCYLINGSVLLSNKDSIPISFSGTNKSFIVKYSADFDTILWYKELVTSNVSSNYFRVSKINIGQDNQLYIAAVLRGRVSATIDKSTYNFLNNFTKGVLIILDTSGKFIHSGLINTDISQQDNLIDIKAIDTNNIYLMGYVQDSLNFGGKWYRAKNPKSKGYGYPFIVKLNLNTGAKWVNLTEDKINVSSLYFSYNIGRINLDKEGSVYATFGSFTNTTSIGGLSVTNCCNYSFVKFDTLGNALWLRSVWWVSDFQPDSLNIIYCGYYLDSLELKPFILKAPSFGKFCGFIAKTFDYAIRRGNINTGPYCAGDTILIPYTKDGEYDSSNIFIAEISDEDGKFDGKEKELGRIKSNKKGEIIGILPMLQSVSSGKYRIRIRSTNPVVQSNYKADGLKLLIYSRDKANPGPTETICFGDSIKLNTYGGTKWTWSPKYNMDDSTKRQPLVWPAKTTIYKIIIADSSGCGQPDTAYKLIKVREAIKANLAFSDSFVCKNKPLKIPVQFTGGDSTNYKWQYFFVSSPKLWFAIRKDSLKLNDTLAYSPTDPIEKLAVILNDDCTNKPDTAYITLRLNNTNTIKTKFSDTNLCFGQSISYKSKATDTKNTQWQWKDITNKRILSTTDSLTFIADKSSKILVILNNGCMQDTGIFTITVKPPLKATSNLRDTSICFGQTINYTAQATGGESKNYSYSWLLDKKEISQTDNLLLSSNYYPNSASNSTLALTFILKDNCSPNDTIKKTITIKPAPKADFNYDLACSRTATKFTFTGTKPSSPITTNFNWDFNKEATSTLENPSYKFATVGTSTSILTLTSSNGCSDTLIKKIEVKAQAKADFQTKDICESDSAVFINKSIDATNYKWRFGDGQTSNLQTPKHKYKIPRTTTFNVSLVAVVTNGCSDSIGSAITVNKNPDADFTYTQTGTKLELKAKSGYSTYRWKFDSKDSVSTSMANYTYTLKTWNPLTICLKTSDNGCQTETCKSIPLGVSSILKPDGFKLYPNPNTGNFIIEIDNLLKDASLEVYNSVGELVEKVEIVGKVTGLDLKLVAGIYLVRVRNGREVFNSKVSVGEDTNR